MWACFRAFPVCLGVGVCPGIFFGKGRGTEQQIHNDQIEKLIQVKV